MFERYTEKARRTIFFARYEASQFGSRSIQPGHILLGLLREDRKLVPWLDAEAIRKGVEAMYPLGEKVSVSVDIPFSEAARVILSHAAEEAERLNHHNVGTGHFLLALLDDPGSPCARLLTAQGVDREAFRNKLAGPPPPDPVAAHPLVTVGQKVADTTRICNGHEIRTIERIQLSEEGKRLVYTIEVRGPGKTGTYEIEFELDKE